MMTTGYMKKMKCIEGRHPSFPPRFLFFTQLLLMHTHSHIYYDRSAATAAANVSLTDIYRTTTTTTNNNNTTTTNNNNNNYVDDEFGVYEENEFYRKSAARVAANVPLTDIYRDGDDISNTEGRTHYHQKGLNAAGGADGDYQYQYENAFYRQRANVIKINNNFNASGSSNDNVYHSRIATDEDTLSARASINDSESASARASIRDTASAGDLWGFGRATARTREEEEGGDIDSLHPLPPVPSQLLRSPERNNGGNYGRGGGSGGRGGLSGTNNDGGVNTYVGGGSNDGGRGGGVSRGRQLFGPARRRAKDMG